MDNDLKVGMILALMLMIIGVIATLHSSSALINNPNLPKITSDRTTVLTSVNNNSLNVNNSNCWKNDCVGFRDTSNQATNTTSNVQFVNITTTDTFLSTLAGISGTWHKYFVLGTLVEIGRVTSELGVFQIRSASNLPIYFSNDDTTGLFSVSDNGETFARSSLNFFVDNSVGVKSLESNGTKTTIYTNLTVNASLSNFTNNIIVGGNLTIRNITASLDVCITSGKCLNQTITLSSNPAFNNTFAYWSNDTRTWNVIPESPAKNEAPVYCTSASVGRWTFIDNTAGVCPL